MKNITRQWIEAVLSNDEASTDAELIALFVDNGVPQYSAQRWVAQRNHYMGRLVIR